MFMPLPQSNPRGHGRGGWDTTAAPQNTAGYGTLLEAMLTGQTANPPRPSLNRIAWRPVQS